MSEPQQSLPTVEQSHHGPRPTGGARRTRAETEQDLYVGAGHDILRRVDGAWKIADRKLLLDQNVLLPKNVSVFF